MLGTVLSSASAVVVVILLLGLSIFVHEFGHYIAARMCGLVVDVFSIGFGPALWKRKRNGTTYKICVIPFGGYVALPQLDPTGMALVQGGEDDKDKTGADSEGGEKKAEQTHAKLRQLPQISAWKKMVVSVAGAAGNVVLAVFLAVLVWWQGMPADPSQKSAAVGEVTVESEAYAKGLRLGDLVTQVNGRPVNNWRDVRLAVALDALATLDAVSPDGERKHMELTTERADMGGRRLQGVFGRGLCQVQGIVPDSPASRTELKRDDIIVTLGGHEVLSHAHLVRMIHQSEGKTLPMVVKRWVGGKPTLLSLAITPGARPKEQLDKDTKASPVWIGVGFNSRAVDREIIVNPNPWEQISFHSTAIFRFLAALTRPEQRGIAADAVGGPVSILTVAWYTVRTSIMLTIWFMGFLNINLAIINLLPIPVLDGGHMVFSFYEMVCRRPLPPRVVNALVNVFAILLIALIVFLSFRDVQRWFFHPKSEPATEEAQSAVGTNGVPATTVPTANPVSP